MKSKIWIAVLFAILIYSCSPKLAIGTQQPDIVQVPPKIASPNESTMSVEVAEGKILYENKCAACHVLHAPSEYSKEDWPPILVRMQKKAHLDDAVMAKISTYIYANLY